MFLFRLANTSRISENKCFLIPRGKSDSSQLTIFSFGVITARKRSFRKVIFLHLSVILFTLGVSLTDIFLDRDPPGLRYPPGHRHPLDRDPLDRHPPYSNERAVRILLECILFS